MQAPAKKNMVLVSNRTSLFFCYVHTVLSNHLWFLGTIPNGCVTINLHHFTRNKYIPLLRTTPEYQCGYELLRNQHVIYICKTYIFAYILRVHIVQSPLWVCFALCIIVANAFPVSGKRFCRLNDGQRLRRIYALTQYMNRIRDQYT